MTAARRMTRHTSSLRRQGREAGGHRGGVHRVQAHRRQQRERLLLATGRPRPARTVIAHAVDVGRPDARHRPDARWPRPGHRLHRRQRHRCLGSVVRGGPDGPLGAAYEPAGFAAKIVSDAAADGAFHWQAVGRGTAGLKQVLDTSGATHGFGPCAESQAAEDACSLNRVPGTTPRTRAWRPGRSRPVAPRCRGSSGKRTWAAARTPSSCHVSSAPITSSSSTRVSRSPTP